MLLDMEITLKSCDEIIDKNWEYTKRLGFNITEIKNCRLCTGFLKCMHKNLTGARLIIESKICSIKKISKSVSNTLNLYTPKLNIFIKMLNSYQIINGLGSYNILTPLFNH